jgi:biopolymer transport protein ExbD
MPKKAPSLQSANATSEPMVEMNMTPLIDVMLVLIIMLIITIPKQNHSIDLGLSGAPSDKAPPAVVTVDVDFDGALSWDGVAVASKEALAKRFALIARGATPTEVHVRANRLAPYKYVAGVMASAKQNGVVGIGLVGNEQFM